LAEGFAIGLFEAGFPTRLLVDGLATCLLAVDLVRCLLPGADLAVCLFAVGFAMRLPVVAVFDVGRLDPAAFFTGFATALRRAPPVFDLEDTAFDVALRFGPTAFFVDLPRPLPAPTFLDVRLFLDPATLRAEVFLDDNALPADAFFEVSFLAPERVFFDERVLEPDRYFLDARAFFEEASPIFLTPAAPNLADDTLGFESLFTPPATFLAFFKSDLAVPALEARVFAPTVFLLERPRTPPDAVFLAARSFDTEPIFDFAVEESLAFLVRALEETAVAAAFLFPADFPAASSFETAPILALAVEETLASFATAFALGLDRMEHIWRRTR